MTEHADHASRIHALEDRVNALTRRLRRLEGRLGGELPPPNDYVKRVRNVFASTGQEVLTLAEVERLSKVSRPTINRIVASYPDMIIRGRRVPVGGLKGRPAIVLARTPRRGEARPTHMPDSALIVWDPEP